MLKFVMIDQTAVSHLSRMVRACPAAAAAAALLQGAYLLRSEQD
jgi:hypothetical protein